MLSLRTDPADRVEGFKWHMVAKTAGKGDLMLDDMLAHADQDEVNKAKQAAARWLGSTLK